VSELSARKGTGVSGRGGECPRDGLSDAQERLETGSAGLPTGLNLSVLEMTLAPFAPKLSARKRTGVSGPAGEFPGDGLSDTQRTIGNGLSGPTDRAEPAGSRNDAGTFCWPGPSTAIGSGLNRPTGLLNLSVLEMTPGLLLAACRSQ
jgi:hypothetical protein